MPVLYVARDLRTAKLAMLASPMPARLWVVPQGGDGSAVAMWLLTPALFACLQLQGERIDSRVLAGELPAERARVGAQQFAAVYEYANQWFADDEVEVAYREFAAGGPQAVGEYVASLGEPEAEDAGRGPWVDIGDVAVASGWQWTPWAEHQIPDTSAGA